MSNLQPSYSLSVGHYLFPVPLANLERLQSLLHGPLDWGGGVVICNLNHKERNYQYLLTCLSSTVSLQSLV